MANKGNAIGTQTISIPHVDESKLDVLKDFYLVYGNMRCVYKFSSGKLIKVNVKDEKEALRVVNKLLQVVKPEMNQGTAKAHGIFTQLPEDGEGHELVGERGKLFNVYVFDREGNKRHHFFKKETEEG